MSFEELNKNFENYDVIKGAPENISSGCSSANKTLTNRFKTKSLSNNFGSSISLDNFFLNELSPHPSKGWSNEEIANQSKCMDELLSNTHLTEILSSPNFKISKLKRNNSYEKENTLVDNDFTVDTQQVPLDVNTSTSDCEQTNVEECLLELDDYLEKMDTNYDHAANTNISTIAAPFGIISQFDRSSRLRNTISCTLDKQENGINSQLAKTKKKILDINREIPQRSTNTDISKSFENINTFALKNKGENTNTVRSNGSQVLTDDRIFQNLIEQQATCVHHIENDGVRQFGRRAERYSTPLFSGNQICDNTRPMNSPVAIILSISSGDSQNECVTSNGSTTRTSRNRSSVSIESNTDSAESLEILDNMGEPNINVNENSQHCENLTDSENIDTLLKSGFNSYWPHTYSRTLALISCTLGLFNISRFAVLTINYGGNFLIQFLMLSIIFGIPFLWLQMSLGTKIEAGPISMWKISPICIGIGISLIFVQYFIAIYSSVVIVWLLIFIRDILINTSYPWSESINSISPPQSSHIFFNITESVPEYFNVNVLQRLKVNDGNGVRLHISDRQVAFYLAILWAVVFLILCKGLKSLGKVILLLVSLSILSLAAIAIKLLLTIDFGKLQEVFSSSEFDEFLVNSKTWAAAAQETFFTWGILGASIVAISSRNHRKSDKLTLRRDAILVVLVTLIGLLLAALIGLCLIQTVNNSGYVYVPGSYENSAYYSAIFSLKSSPNGDLISYPTKFIPHYSSLIGEVYRRHTDTMHVSGYQVLRFVTEILPAAVAISTENISWVWTLIIFLTFLVFGVSQLCIMWKPISSALGNSTSAVLLSCVTGLLLSIPFATEIGIKLLHYMDMLLGGAWFIPVLWVTEIFGVFLIRGRPYNGDDLVNDLRMSGSMSAFLALSWNVLLPIGLIVLAVIEYKTSLSSQWYHWRGKSYFSYWSRKVGALTQIGLLLLVPISATVQIYRYLSSGPPDILDRIQMLYRPLDDINDFESNRRSIANPRYNDQNHESSYRQFQDDAPPKYTPPPSYTTATGARLAKLLRQSLRRSVRRILGGSEGPRPSLSHQNESQNDQVFNPPALSNLPEATNEINSSVTESIEIGNIPSLSSFYGRSLSLGRKQLLNNRRSSRRLRNGPYTAEDVITILRTSTLLRRRATGLEHPQTDFVYRSIENLVDNAEPLNFSSPINDTQHNEQNF